MLITGVINHNGIPFNLVAPQVDESPTMKALSDLSKAFEGTAEELGLKTDQDVVDMIKQMRRERRIKQNESND
jgi:antitoxin component of RelBE/YafQ-DinJ toxin-antitoxin module